MGIHFHKCPIDLNLRQERQARSRVYAIVTRYMLTAGQFGEDEGVSWQAAKYHSARKPTQ
jgi:hypothetical protein